MTDRSENKVQIPEKSRRNHIRSNICFWGRNILQEIEIIISGALLLFLVRWFGRSPEALTDILLGFPYLLLMVGGFLTLMMVLSFFQVYFPVLISMNVTRSAAIAGVWMSQGGVALFLAALMALIWKLVPGEEAAMRLMAMPLFGGIILAMIAVCVILGAVFVRWGKIGGIILFLVCITGGMAVGVFVALNAGEGFLELQQMTYVDLAGIKGGSVLLAGVLLYVVSGLFSWLVTRNAEVRV